MAVDSKYLIIDVPVTNSLTAYTAKDVVGGLLTVTIDSNLGGGILNQVTIINEEVIAEAFTLYFSDAAPSSIADAAIYAPTIADLQKNFAIVNIASGDWVDVQGVGINVVNKTDLNHVFEADGGNKIYMYFVATETPDWVTATDAVLIRLHILTEGY